MCTGVVWMDASIKTLLPRPYTYRIITPTHTSHIVHKQTPQPKQQQAYQDIDPLLTGLAGLLHPPTVPSASSNSKAQLTIYDPYFCQGRVTRLLASLGYEASRVINQMRDFYADVKHGSVPSHDVLVTNPPFSGQHKVRWGGWLGY